MLVRYKSGAVIAWGGCARDGTVDYVGDKATPVCKMGVAVDKRMDGGGSGETVWANVVAWRDMAYALARAKKGETVFVAGYTKEHEYNGKVYTDLVAEWVGVASAGAEQRPPTQEPGAFSEIADDEEDGELPF